MQPDAALVLDRAAAAEQPSPEDLRAWTADQRVFISSVMAGLERSATHRYERTGPVTVLVKVVDVFGNDTTLALEARIR